MIEQKKSLKAECKDLLDLSGTRDETRFLTEALMETQAGLKRAVALQVTDSEPTISEKLAELKIKVSSVELITESAKISGSCNRTPLVKIEINNEEIANPDVDVLVIYPIEFNLHPLVLWEKVESVLGMNGVVTIFFRHENHRDYRLSRWIEYCVKIGQRFGFDQLGIDCLIRADDRLYAISMQKKRVPRWNIKHVEPKYQPAIAKLFRSIFESEMSFAFWRWKYSNGGGGSILAERDGKIVGHYGGIYRNILLFGESDWAFQICDVMVTPEERGIFTKDGPFNLMARTSAEIYGPLGYGFPNERHAKLAEKAGIGNSMCEMIELSWKPRHSIKKSLYKFQLFKEPTPFWIRETNGCWHKMAKSLSSDVVGIRDWDYISSRYVNHPQTKYDILIISRFLGIRTLCVAVFKKEGNTVEVMDVIAPVDAMSTVFEALQLFFVGSFDLEIVFWIADNQFAHFKDSAPRVRKLNISVPNSAWTNHPRAAAMKNKWWLTSGDTDFR